MSRKIIYLINPISGTKGKSSLQDLITRRTKAQNIEFSLIPTNAAGNYDHLIPVIEQEKITDIVVCGGDGTVNAVAAALMGTTTRIGIVPTGSGNGLAFAARIPASPSRALDLIFAGKASPVDGFMINDRFSCMLCGIGFDAEVAHEFAKQKTRGLQTYIRVSFSRFFRAGAYRFRINVPAPQGAEYNFPVDAFFISVANGNQFGNNFTIAPKARLDDGLLDIVVVKRMGKFHLVLAVLRQVLGGNRLRAVSDRLHRSTILYFQTPTLTIDNPDEAPLHIDGDPSATAQHFNIRIVPGAFTLIQP